MKHSPPLQNTRARALWAVVLFALMGLGLAPAAVAQSAPPAAASTATQAQHLQAIAAQLNAHAPAVLRGEFSQQKVIQGFKKPLLSSGNFAIARERGLAWNTLTPFASSLFITPNRLRSVANGETTTLDASKEPGLKAFNDLLIALLSGQLEALNTQFTISQLSVDGPRWSVTLQPEQAGLAQFIAQLHIQGQDFVEQVVLTEANGDHSTISFHNQHAAALTPTESDWLQ